MMKNKESNEFKLILKILDDYWLSEPNELRVRVTMDFIHSNGEFTTKRIVWQNPKFTCDPPFNPCLLNRLSDSNDGIIMNEDEKFWNVQDIRRTS